MALNFTVSYTFSPSTTISSSQVNTNTSDVANVFTGLEAETKTLAKLKVDIDPTLALEVATKQYVDHYSTWRRPSIQWASVSTVSIESGLDGTSGDIPMLFPDGSMRTETSATRTTFDITRNAVLTSSGGQSGLRATLSEAANTWYSLYAVKCTDDTTKWMTVGDTLIPTRANFSTLNSNFGTNGWVYLGLAPNGDNAGATSDLARFWQVGHFTQFENACAGVVSTPNGLKLTSTAGATTLTYTYASGTAIGSGQIPGHVLSGILTIEQNSSTSWNVANTLNGSNLFLMGGISGAGLIHVPITFQDGLINTPSGSTAQQITLRAFYDGVLGVGSNPIL